MIDEFQEQPVCLRFPVKRELVAVLEVIVQRVPVILYGVPEFDDVLFRYVTQLVRKKSCHDTEPSASVLKYPAYEIWINDDDRIVFFQFVTEHFLAELLDF